MIIYEEGDLWEDLFPDDRPTLFLLERLIKSIGVYGNEDRCTSKCQKMKEQFTLGL